MPRTPQAIILDLLSGFYWYVPHEVNIQLRLQGCHVSAEATTARMRDLRKKKYGAHHLVKRIRKGTDYFEYRIERQEEKAA
jgi:hypothetical protein